jgi:hypothetical protein
LYWERKDVFHPCRADRFFLGGNLVLKLAGEWGNEGPAKFRAVPAVCPAVNLAAGADALHEPANRIYEYYFLAQLFRRFRHKARLFPGCFEAAWGSHSAISTPVSPLTIAGSRASTIITLGPPQPM